MIYLDGRPVRFETFPNGEVRLPALAITHVVPYCVTFQYDGDASLLHLMFLKRYLDKLFPNCPLRLSIMYLPYSRMDRDGDGAFAFTLKSVAEFINQLGFDSVIVEEPHSDVAVALLDRATARNTTMALLPDVLHLTQFNTDRDFIYLPDAGAAKRYGSHLDNYRVATGIKNRDFQTGELTGHPLVFGFTPGLYQPRVLIVDDLCSYGGTFLRASRVLKDQGAKEVHLLVTHCERSVFNGGLLNDIDGIDGLYCTNSIMPVDEYEHHKLHVYNLLNKGWT